MSQGNILDVKIMVNIMFCGQSFSGKKWNMNFLSRYLDHEDKLTPCWPNFNVTTKLLRKTNMLGHFQTFWEFFPHHTILPTLEIYTYKWKWICIFLLYLLVCSLQPVSSGSISTHAKSLIIYNAGHQHNFCCSSVSFVPAKTILTFYY